MQREAMEFDVLIVGGGPAGLASAIRLKQMANEAGREISVCLIEKVPRSAPTSPPAPSWTRRPSPNCSRTGRRTAPRSMRPSPRIAFLVLSGNRRKQVPNMLLPGCFQNHGNYVISLGNVCRWLGQQAEAMGVEVYAGFAGAEVLFDDNGAVKGVATGDMGRLRDGSEGPASSSAWNCTPNTPSSPRLPRHLGKAAAGAFRSERRPRCTDLRHRPQGLWEIKPEMHRKVWSSTPAAGRSTRIPMAAASSTTSENNQITIGYVVGLGYENPTSRRSRNSSASRRTRRSAEVPRGRQAHRLRRPRHRCRRPAVAAEAHLPRRRAGRRRRGISSTPAASRVRTARSSPALAAGPASRHWPPSVSATNSPHSAEIRAELALRRALPRAKPSPWMAKGMQFGGLMFGIDQILFRGKAPWTRCTTVARTTPS